MRLVIVRHTRVAVPKGTIYGQTDVELADSAATDIAAVHELLPTHCDYLYSSPLRRCRQLANTLAHRYDTPVLLDKRIMEMDFGHWEGKHWDEIPREQAKRWGNNWLTEPAPCGESFQDVRARVAQFCQRALLHEQHKTVIIVSHSGPLRCLCLQIHPQYQAWPEHKAFQIPLEYGAVETFEFIPGS